MSKPVQRSLKWRLLARISSALFLILMLGALAVSALAHRIGTAIYDDWLYDSAMTLSKQVRFVAGRPTLDIPEPAMEMFRWDRVDKIFAEVISPDAGTLYSSGKFAAPPTDLTIGKPRFYDGTVNGLPVRVVAILVKPGKQPEALLVQVAETKRKRETLVASILQLVAPLELIILLATGAAIWLAVTSSLREVNAIARRLADYDPTDMSPVDESDAPEEVKPLIRSINGLLAKLENLQRSQRRFISDAAHQLRTPLAALQVQAERATREADPSRVRDALTQILRVLVRLRRVTQQLLSLARSSAIALQMDTVRINLVDALREELEQHTDAADARHIDLGYEGPDSGVHVNAEPHLLREMIGNLIDNAIRYTQPGGHITAGITTQPVALTIDDDGPGIADAEKVHILEPFYRPRGVTEDGCGLGLAIAAETAAKHGAVLRIRDNPAGRGTRVEIVFASEEKTPGSPRRSSDGAA